MFWRFSDDHYAELMSRPEMYEALVEMEKAATSGTGQLHVISTTVHASRNN